MTEKNPASCPGISQFMRPTPSYFKCPKCQGDVEIWSDEEETPCPKCGTVISPDDETEEIYQIVETKVKNDELAELVLMCKRCGSTIKLVGFLSQPES